MRGKFIYGHGGLGLGKEFNNSGGFETHKLTTDEMPSHTHTMNKSGNHTHTYTDRYGGGSTGDTDRGHGDGRPTSKDFNTGIAGDHAHTINNTGGNKAYNNMPQFHVLTYIMKTESNPDTSKINIDNVLSKPKRKKFLGIF